MQRDNQDFSDICRAKQGHVKLMGYVSYSYIARCATLATRAHPSVTDVHYAQCTNISTHGNASFVGGGYALCRWKRLLCAWERALYAWKRRCADVRAGTQAPPLPFLMWFRVTKLPKNSLPRHKHKCIVVARCSPLHKKEFIVAANSLPLH